MIEGNAPGMGFELVFIGPGGSGFLNFLFARGWGIRLSKKLPGGMVRLGISSFQPIFDCAIIVTSHILMRFYFQKQC